MPTRLRSISSGLAHVKKMTLLRVLTIASEVGWYGKGKRYVLVQLTTSYIQDTESARGKGPRKIYCAVPSSREKGSTGRLGIGA